MVKFVLDSLNKIFYADDAQIVKIIAEKNYNEVPRTEVTIKQIS